MILRLFVCVYLMCFSSFVYSKEIPTIVISAGKTIQSYSSVGTHVTVIDSETIENSSETFLTDLLNDETQGFTITYDFDENSILSARIRLGHFCM